MVIPAFSRIFGTFFSAPIAMICTPSQMPSSLIFAIISAAHLDTKLCGQSLNALLLALCCRSGETVNHILGYCDTRYILIHVFRHTSCLQRDDTCHDVGMDVCLIHLVHETLQAFDIKDTLGLDVLCACVYLLAQLVNLQRKRIINGVTAAPL